MSNTNELTAKLKAAAEKAGIEQWVNNRGEVNTADYEVDGGVYIDHICNCEIVGTESPQSEFIAMANPANILALVEALENYKAAYEEEARDKAVQRTVIDDALCKLLPGCHYMDPPDGGSVTPLEQVTRMVEDYRQRIAELEARTLTVKLPDYVDGHTLGYGEVNHMIDLCADAIEKACHRDGIKLQIEGE